MFRRIFLALLLALGVAATGAAAQSNTDIITGRVTGPTGEPLQGVSVRATSLESGVVRATLTNAQGRYTLVFPQGDGQYQMEYHHLGLATVSRPLVRIGDEEVLVAEIQMSIQPIALEGVDVTARRAPPRFGSEPGGQERALTGEALDRLPIDASDLAAIAALTPGVVALGDSIGGFSVLGQGPAGNSFTLDGASFDGGDMFGGGAGTGVPQEAIRMTRVITNTYDVSRGQFSGGQIAGTTRAGTNNLQGQVNYSLRDPTLQWTAEDGPFAGAFRQNRVSGGVGGPIIRDRLFYFGSVQLQRRSEGLQSLLSADSRSLQRLGASPDSVSQFLSVLTGYGLHTPGLAFPDARISDMVNVLGRIDFNVTDMHTVTLRGDMRSTEQNNFRTGALGLPQSGGVMENNGGGLMLSATSRFGNGWVNEFRAYGSDNRRDMAPYQILPEGRVRVSSDLEDGTRGITTFTFGGNSFANSSRDRSLELSNELSLLLGLSHRVRIGGLLNASSSTQEIGNNRFGTFTFNSLAAFEAGRPASFTRNLVPGQRESGGISGALYAGDTWRATERLQLTYGARLEASRVGQQPDYNPVIEERFGYRTDEVPSEVRVSPRVGFSYTVGGGGAGAGGFGGGAFGGMASQFGIGQATVIRGGFGEFRNRPAWGLFASARDATGLPTGQSQIYCVGDAVPFPDWSAFAADLNSVPMSCAGAPSPIPTSGRGTNVSVFDQDFGASRSWRASLGFQRQLRSMIGMTFDATYALGVAQQGVRDLNLNTTPQFSLAAEGGRPVFAPVAAVVPATGEIGFLASRIHRDMGQVSEIHSDLQSRNVQFTLGLNGAIPAARIFFQSSYTHGRSRDQGSAAGWGFGGGMGGFGFGGFGGGGGGFGGMGGGFGGGGASGLPLTAGNPNLAEWGRSDFERRHSLMGTVGRQFNPWLNMSLVGRATSGTPFTPIVGGDINGDGARNDLAFIFDPARTADARLAADMNRLLQVAPSSARACLERQLGSIAERNSCSSPWTYNLDLRAQLQPNLPGLDRRLSISIDASNALVGVDQLLHGSNGLRGWGQMTRVDPILLYPRGFDPGTQSFRYEVNERFGDARQTGLAIRNPFQIQISGRIAVGQQRGGFGGMMGGFGGRGGGGGGFIFPFPGGGPGGAAGGAAGGGNPMAGANPVQSIIAMRDSLQLTAEQVTQLEEVSARLQEEQDKVQEEMRAQLSRGGGGDPSTLMRTLMPRIQEVREQFIVSIAEAQEILTPEQWEQVPAALKEPPRMPGFGGPGGPGGGRGGQGGGGGRGPGGGQLH
jgi:hypothetical protein